MHDSPLIRGTRIRSFQAASPRRRGGALALALIVAVTVAAAAGAILMFTMHFTRRQTHAVHDQRAFYLAEAGLSEAYVALTSGQSGQIGSMQAPAAAGEGLLWVDATPNADGTVLLESTALVGLGRSSLSLVVERIEQPLGIFADEDLIIDAPILVDGYDSEAAPYEEQVERRGIVKVPKDLTAPDDGSETPPYDGAVLVDFMGAEFLVVGGDETSYFLELYDTNDSDMLSVLKMLNELYSGNAPIDELPVDWAFYDQAFLQTVHDLGWADLSAYLDAPVVPMDSDAAWAASVDSGWAASTDASVSVDLAPVTTTSAGGHTSGGGKLASNGSIEFTGPSAEIYGDVVSGPEGDVVLGSGTYVAGTTSARPVAIELTPVGLPSVALDPAIVYGGATPLIIPPSVVGYEGLTVLPDAELIVYGPSTVVIGDFLLQGRAHLSVENVDGPVDLYVVRTAELAFGSSIDVASTDPDQLTLRFVGDAGPIVLASTAQFHGMIYGPGAAIAVESPFEVYGALVGRSLDLGGGVRLHFDSGLAGGRLPLPKLISWDVSEVPTALKTRRVEAFTALDVAKEDLLPPSEAVESYSWTARATYVSQSTGQVRIYEGPFEQFLYEDVDAMLDFSLTPPDVDFGESWTVRARYKPLIGLETTWEGPVEDYPHHMIAVLYERTLTPPAGLVAMGYEGSHYVRP